MDPVLKSKIVSIELFKGTKAMPIVVNLQNGKFRQTKDLVVKRVEHEESGDKFALIATQDSVYKSDITNAGSAYVNSFLAIRNKRTNEMKLVQVHEASFKHVLYDNKKSIFENNVVDAKKILNKEFGGKRALASYERQKRSVPNIDMLEETLEKQLNTIDDKIFEKDIFDQSQDDREQLRKSIFPDIKATAGSSVRDIFNAQALLGKDLMEHLSEAAIQVLQMETKDISFANKHLTSSVRAIQITKRPDSEENIERISLFIYIDGLVRLINCRKRTLEQAELSLFSERVARDIRQKFSIQGNLANSKFTKQKSLIYYLILVLIASEKLEVDIENILESVDVTKTEMLKYAGVIGAKVKNKKTLFIQQPKLDIDQKLFVDLPPQKKRRK